MKRLIGVVSTLVFFLCSANAQESIYVPDSPGAILIPLPKLPTCSEQVTKPSRIYPHAKSRGVVHLAGIIGDLGCSPQTLAGGGFEAELKQILLNLGQSLGELNLSHGEVLTCQTYLTDIGDYEKISSVYREMLTNGPPPMSIVEVSALPFGASVQMNCSAAYPEPRGEGLWPAK